MKLRKEIYMNGTKKKRKNYYYRVVTKDGEILSFGKLSLSEAVSFCKELNELDKIDGTYEENFYQLERVWY